MSKDTKDPRKDRGLFTPQEQEKADAEEKAMMAQLEREATEKDKPGSIGQTMDDLRDRGLPSREEAQDRAKSLATSSKNRTVLERDLDLAQRRHTAVGGAFTTAAIDPTETEEALKARNDGELRSRRVKGGAPPGYKNYYIPKAYYREGVYAEGDCIISIPADEKPSITWEEVEADANPTYVFPPLPKAPPTRLQRTVRIPAQDIKVDSVRASDKDL